MNIFVLDTNPTMAAQYYVDRHVSAGIYELAQLLSTAHVMLDGRGNAQARVALVEMNQRERAAGREPYIQHPCAVWVRESRANYDWTAALAWGLVREAGDRFAKPNPLAGAVIDLQRYRPLNIPLIERTPFIQSVPDRFKYVEEYGDAPGSAAVRAYREYYFATRQPLAKWTGARAPQWWTDLVGEKISA